MGVDLHVNALILVGNLLQPVLTLIEVSVQMTLLSLEESLLAQAHTRLARNCLLLNGLGLTAKHSIIEAINGLLRWFSGIVAYVVKGECGLDGWEVDGSSGCNFAAKEWS